MTISQAIVDFLSGYEEIEIDMNHVSDGSDRYGLFKSPSRDTKDFICSEYEITEYYNFIAKQVSVSASERKESDEWLEDLAYWVDDKSYAGDFPDLGKNRKIRNVEITGIPYPMETNEKETLYQMSLSITYTREREDF